jgi:hypothetical protein
MTKYMANLVLNFKPLSQLQYIGFNAVLKICLVSSDS